MAVADTILITNINKGYGMDLLNHILSQEKLPRAVIATGDFTKAEKDELEKTARQFPAVLKVRQLNVLDDETVESTFRYLGMELAHCGLSLLISNTVVVDPKAKLISEQTREDLKRSYETTVVAPLMLAKTFRPLLEIASKTPKNSCHRTPADSATASPAVIVNMTFHFPDVKILSSAVCCYHYRAARAALNTVTRMLADDLKNSGILVVGLQPKLPAIEATQKEPPVAPDSSSSFASGSGGTKATSPWAKYLTPEFRTETARRIWDTIKHLPPNASGYNFNLDGWTLPL